MKRKIVLELNLDLEIITRDNESNGVEVTSIDYDPHLFTFNIEPEGKSFADVLTEFKLQFRRWAIKKHGTANQASKAFNLSGGTLKYWEPKNKSFKRLKKTT